MSSRPDEFGLIERYLAPLATDPGALGLKDDAAVYSPPAGFDLIVTTDLLAAGVHFFADDPPEAIAAKALRVNLSDLAAKGAEPAAYFLSLALPADWDEPWMQRFAAGLKADQEQYGVALLGGDTSRTGDGLTLSVTALGLVPSGSMVKRGSARAGDRVYVTGTIGDSALGLQIRLGSLDPDLAAGQGATLLDRYLYPQPRTALAEVLRECANSAMDVSDGLLGDFGHICKVSGLAGTIEATALPLSGAARAVLDNDPKLLATIANGGDDYEILATVSEDRAPAFESMAERKGIRVSLIGRMDSRPGRPQLVDGNGEPIDIETASHQHF